MTTKIDDFLKRVESTAEVDLFTPRTSYHLSSSMFHEMCELLKEQEAVKPKYIDGKRNHFIRCGNCNTDLMKGMKFCSYCGKAVKWDDRPISKGVGKHWKSTIFTIKDDFLDC